MCVRGGRSKLFFAVIFGYCWLMHCFKMYFHIERQILGLLFFRFIGTMISIHLIVCLIAVIAVCSVFLNCFYDVHVNFVSVKNHY